VTTFERIFLALLLVACAGIWAQAGSNTLVAFETARLTRETKAANEQLKVATDALRVKQTEVR
jgi:hypothetical protein